MRLVKRDACNIPTGNSIKPPYYCLSRKKSIWNVLDKSIYRSTENG